jgi:hypothetical protein
MDPGLACLQGAPDVLEHPDGTRASGRCCRPVGGARPGRYPTADRLAEAEVVARCRARWIRRVAAVSRADAVWSLLQLTDAP